VRSNQQGSSGCPDGSFNICKIGPLYGKIALMATKAEGISPEILCEKCRKKKAEKEFLILQTEIIYLCEECAGILKPFTPFLKKRKRNTEQRIEGVLWC
jgi:hypothetical protein